jgi:hypothetical protein
MPTGSSAWCAPIPRRRKHDGISFILFDMASKGVSTKPILLISAIRRSAKPSSTMCACRNRMWLARSTAAGTSQNICCSMSAR